MKKEFTFSKGITIIEIILVVSLVSIIGMSSVAFYSRFFAQNAVANTSEQLVSAFRKAQSYAMSSKQNANWGVHYASNQIVLFQGTSWASRATAFDEVTKVNSNITISGFTDIIFNRPTGTSSATATITISGPGQSETITVSSQGVVNRD